MIVSDIANKGANLFNVNKGQHSCNGFYLVGPWFKS